MEQLKKEFEERFVAEIHGQALWDDNDKKLWEWVKSKIEQAQQQVSVEPEVKVNFVEVKEVLNETEEFINWLNEIIVFPEYLQSTYANSYMNLSNRITELKSKISA